MGDLISRAEAIKIVKSGNGNMTWVERDEIERRIKELPLAERIKAEKDCRNCKYGKWNDHFDNYFCYNPKNCTDWDLWESGECVSADSAEIPKHDRDIIIEELAKRKAGRVGKWEYEKMVMPLSNHTKDSYRCSVCHTHWDCETNYCPNCGARMENNK